MAAPHVAGAAALLRQANPGWSPAQVKAALVSSAERTPNLEGNLPDDGLPARNRGNGRLNVKDAHELPVLISPPSASFGYHNLGGKSKVQSVTLNLQSLSGESMTCSVSATGGVTPSTDNVALNPHGSVTINLNNPNTRTGDEEGDITFSCGNDITITVPWGSYQKPLSRP